MPATEQLSIVLPVEMVRAIRANVDGDAYASDSDVVREAMRAWIERRRQLAALEAKIDEGIADADAGRVGTSDEVSRSLLARLETRAASGIS